MTSQPPVLGDQAPAVFDSSGVDQPVGWIAGERRGQPHRGSGDGWSDADRANMLGEPLKPGQHGNRELDALVFGKPSQFEPRNRGDGELVGMFDGLARGLAERPGSVDHQ